MIQHLSAITLAVRDMQEAVTFYAQLGFEVVYGGPQERFSSMRAGEGYVNLILTPDYTPQWWGRTIFRVTQVDELHRTLTARGLTPTPLRDGSWGERFFHLTDPNGHELSFAQLMPKLS